MYISIFLSILKVCFVYFVPFMALPILDNQTDIQIAVFSFENSTTEKSVWVCVYLTRSHQYFFSIDHIKWTAVQNSFEILINRTSRIARQVQDKDLSLVSGTYMVKEDSHPLQVVTITHNIHSHHAPHTHSHTHNRHTHIHTHYKHTQHKHHMQLNIFDKCWCPLKKNLLLICVFHSSK